MCTHVYLLYISQYVPSKGTCALKQLNNFILAIRIGFFLSMKPLLHNICVQMIALEMSCSRTATIVCKLWAMCTKSGPCVQAVGYVRRVLLAEAIEHLNKRTLKGKFLEEEIPLFVCSLFACVCTCMYVLVCVEIMKISIFLEPAPQLQPISSDIIATIISSLEELHRVLQKNPLPHTPIFHLLPKVQHLQDELFPSLTRLFESRLKKKQRNYLFRPFHIYSS